MLVPLDPKTGKRKKESGMSKDEKKDIEIATRRAEKAKEAKKK